jgi:transposase
MKMRDELGTFYQDQDFEKLFPKRGQPAQSPWRLALVSVMQFAEGLSDRQAAEAVRARIDWKYALGLELSDEGFDFSVLSEFRDRLLAGGAEQLLLNKMLEQFKAKGLLKAGGKQRTDSTHILAAARQLNRLETVGETLRAALNALAEANPDWLRKQISPQWIERYGRRIEDYHLPKGKQQRQEYASQIGLDGFALLTALESDPQIEQLQQLSAVKILKHVWAHQYEQRDGKVQFRSKDDETEPVGNRINSPYDEEAHFGNKGNKTWLGYRVHITESCDEESAHLITDVKTTNATTSDVEIGEEIEKDLAQKQLLPTEHLMDGGYIDSKFIVNAQDQYGVTLIGPARSNNHWQKRIASGYDLTQFHIDWENKIASCPAGAKTTSWYPDKGKAGQEWIDIRFKKTDCRDCSVRNQCTRSKNEPRELRLLPFAQQQALQLAREKQTTDEWKKQYKVRAGIEGTISQAVRAFDLRQSRYFGEAKTHLQNILIAVAVNLSRVISWLNEIPRAKTRTSKFAALATAI